MLSYEDDLSRQLDQSLQSQITGHRKDVSILKPSDLVEEFPVDHLEQRDTVWQSPHTVAESKAILGSGW